MTRTVDARRRNGRYLLPGVDNFARVLFTLFGSLFILVPMVVVACVTSKRYLLRTTVLFVLLFALSLDYFSKGSDRDLIAATAAYAAILVVFVGNNISRDIIDRSHVISRLRIFFTLYLFLMILSGFSSSISRLDSILTPLDTTKIAALSPRAQAVNSSPTLSLPDDSLPPSSFPDGFLLKEVKSTTG